MTKDERKQKIKESFEEFINSFEEEFPEKAEILRKTMLTNECIEYLAMKDHETINRACAVLRYKAKDET